MNKDKFSTCFIFHISTHFKYTFQLIKTQVIFKLNLGFELLTDLFSIISNSILKLMLRLLPIFLFISSCTICWETNEQKIDYKFETFIKMKDSTQIIQKLEYEGSTLNLYPQSFLVKIPLSFLKSSKIKVYTSLDTGLLFVQPISNKEVVLKEFCDEKLEYTIFKEFEYSYNGKFQMNLIRSSFNINDWKILPYTLNIDTLILE